MPADGNTYPRQAQAFRTLLTTQCHEDARLAGFGGPTEPGTDGGFAVHFDGRGSLASIVIVGSDGQVEITGFAAIRALSDAVSKAEQMAFRMEGA